MKPIILVSLFLSLWSATSYAGCDLDAKVCSGSCKVKHITDDGARNGCLAKCTASEAACLAEVGADAAVEASKEAWNNTKSFFKELSKD